MSQQKLQQSSWEKPEFANLKKLAENLDSMKSLLLQELEVMKAKRKTLLLLKENDSRTR